MAKIPLADKSSATSAKLPEVGSLPKPSNPAVDISTLAARYKDQAPSATPTNHAPDLLVLVSLSLPKATLQRIVEQAERAGATLVFRGLKDDSLTRMGEMIRSLIGERQVSAVIHPPAFQQFSVTRVPTVVLAKQEAGRVLADGCSQADSFVKVSGDVSIDYALDFIERTRPAWKGAAQSYRRRIVGELP